MDEHMLKLLPSDNFTIFHLWREYLFLSYDYTLTSKAPQIWNVHKKCNQIIYNKVWVWKIDFFTIFGDKNMEVGQKKAGKTMEIEKKLFF